jgi:hypothetical protein
VINNKPWAKIKSKVDEHLSSREEMENGLASTVEVGDYYTCPPFRQKIVDMEHRTIRNYLKSANKIRSCEEN